MIGTGFARRGVWLVAALALTVACGDDDDGVPVVDMGPGRDGGDPMTDMFTPDPDGGMCVDDDDDGYGDGCAAGPDCDDTSASISPDATEVCNEVDDDCDGNTDEDLDAPACELTEGVCAGAVARCGADGFLSCDATDYGSDYEADETACDGLDNDCDGTQDEGCSCSPGDTQPCGLDEGACMPGTQTCTAEATWGACEGDVGPMGETCDGLDNDCDGAADEPGELTAPDCPLQQGVCAGSKRACGGAAGWIACSGIASYGGDYQAVETLCDGLDNNCDGVTDEGCDCIDGATQACGTDTGVCMAGVQTCTAGSFGGCAGEVTGGAETCDGMDEDCDGSTDEGVIGAACPLQEGVCAGSTQSCGGAGGFETCDAATYGTGYQATETLCDGLDNDCDGDVDEGCDCVTGTTQECGSSTGACERGSQTCVAGEWSACSGGVTAQPETCNGLDDDCDGVTDDNLTAPACALTEGVCGGAVQTCGGAAGWQACSGTDSYGASFLTDETSADESHCDGLDNDCDGTDDEDCIAIPVVAPPEDVVLPNLHHQHLVYMQNFDGNWDIVFQSLQSGEVRRLTTTATSEWNPVVYGDFVAYVRGEDAAAQVFLYDLRTDTETALSTMQSGSPEIYGGFVVFDEFDGTTWDIRIHDIATGTSDDILVDTPSSNEIQPTIRGNVIAWLSDGPVAGEWRLVAFELGTGSTVVDPTNLAAASSAPPGQLGPVADYFLLAWTDGRAVADGMATTTNDFDIFGSTFGATPQFPAETSLVGGTAAQIANDADGTIYVYTDYSAGDANTGITGFGGTPTALSTHPGTQADATISGDLILWEDNRRGNFDIYGTALATSPAPEAGDLVIHEVMYDPPATDVNGDGTASATQDELVELVNATAGRLDISGVTITIGGTVRHTVPAGTVLPALGTYVVFGGGTPTGTFGGARVATASSGGLNLVNGGATVTLALGGTTLDTMTYASGSATDQSLVRVPAFTGAFMAHSAVTGAVGVVSPGTGADGFPF
ncbi:MAG: lamin tail domain-containing protein [Deltaproteobacteria bacterium]|nr:lamin tail domain-containing protein [Deltaproteobacteria bacterium]